MLSKERVEFEHPAKGPSHCSQCRHFMPEAHVCEIVAGTIEPGDWCNRFSRKKASAGSYVRKGNG